MAEETLQKSLERYDVLERIAVGGMAEVFLAKAYGSHGFEKTLAIKKILPELARDPEFEARFIAEAKVSVRLSHANVVQVLDFGRMGESLFIAMEFVDGLDLAAMQRKFKDENRLIPLPAAFHIAIEIIRALDYAHQHNVVHRDVSPSNILISRAGEVKIADFGIAVAASPHKGGGPGPRKVMGKWRYMSPEQARGDTLDTRSDMFSAASVMFELFTGQKLFPGDESDEIIANIEKMPIPKLNSIRSGIPSRLDEVLAGPLSRKPIDRPTRPAVVLRQLIELSYESSIMATALDVAEALSSVIPPPRSSSASALDDVIRKQLGSQGEKSVARKTAVTGNKPAGTETVERRGESSTGLFRKVDRDGVSRLEEVDPTNTAVAAPRARRVSEQGFAEPLPETTDLHALFDARVDPDRHTEVGGPPTGQVPKQDPAVPTPPETKSISITATTGAPGGRRGLAIAIGVGVVVASGLGIFALTRGDGVAPVVAKLDAAVVLAPAVPKTTIDIDSKPHGARIILDGSVLPGVTPQTVAVKPNVDVAVRLELAGYVAFENIYKPPPNKELAIQPLLTVAPALLHVETTPPGAQVTLEGVPLGVTPLNKSMAAGSGEDLTLVHPGYETAKLKVDLIAGQTAQVTQTLKAAQKFGSVMFEIHDSSSMPHARVIWNNQDKGVTRGIGAPTMFSFPVGPQQFTLIDGTKKKIVKITVVEGTTRTVDATF
jgi:serine/threonine protein kinase